MSSVTELLRGLGVTFKSMFETPVTYQYPEV
jgi:formate hydrogenlyase subunit 6/NADH:ubiquinone oxidoreductase subunit I